MKKKKKDAPVHHAQPGCLIWSHHLRFVHPLTSTAAKFMLPFFTSNENVKTNCDKLPVLACCVTLKHCCQNTLHSYLYFWKPIPSNIIVHHHCKLPAWPEMHIIIISTPKNCLMCEHSMEASTLLGHLVVDVESLHKREEVRNSFCEEMENFLLKELGIAIS